MSETSDANETRWRCLRAMGDCDGSEPMAVLADALDRIAADVAEIKARVDPVIDCLPPPGYTQSHAEPWKWFAPLKPGYRPLDPAPSPPPDLAAIRERDESRAEAERLRAELAARPAAGWLTDRERHVLSSMLSERPCDSSLHWRDDVEPVFRSILARAGSPPVVVLPAMPHRSRQEAECYRAALDKAGVAWKEAPSE